MQKHRIMLEQSLVCLVPSFQLTAAEKSTSKRTWGNAASQNCAGIDDA
jgi:hypothetical protein